MQFSSDAGLCCLCVFGNLATGSDTQGRDILHGVRHICYAYLGKVSALGFWTLAMGNAIMMAFRCHMTCNYDP